MKKVMAEIILRRVIFGIRALFKYAVRSCLDINKFPVNRHICRSFEKHKKILFRKSVLAQTAKTLAAFVIYGYIPDYHNKKFRPIRFYINITFDFFIVKRFWAHTQKNRAEKARLVHYSSSAVPSLSSISFDTVTKLYPLSLSSGRITFSASGCLLRYSRETELYLRSEDCPTPYLQRTRPEVLTSRACPDATTTAPECSRSFLWS